MDTINCRPISLFCDDIDRFWKYVSVSGENDCWPWTAAKNSGGYGELSVDGRPFLAHRISYYLATGTDPHPLMVCHTCDNPPCCNPRHLYRGTAFDNAADAVSRGRMATGDRHRSRVHPESVRRGIEHPLAIFSDEEIRRIRDLYRKGGISQGRLAEEFGTHQMNISRIVRGITWRHVPGTVKEMPDNRIRGERHHRAKLSSDAVMEIRRLFAEGRLNKWELAERFSVTDRTIRNVVSGRFWTSVKQ